MEHGGTFRTKREANLRRDLIGDLLAAGLNPKIELRRRLAPEHPLRDAAAGWAEARRSVADRTRESYVWREVVVLRKWGDVAPQEILVEDVIAWVGELESDYKPGSIRGLVHTLRLMLDHCGGPNPARDRRIQLPRQERREVQPPDADAVRAMLEGLNGLHIAEAIAMELLGTRVSETLTIERRDLLADGVRIRREESKTGKPRIVPAPAFLVDALMERIPLSQNRQAVGNAMRRAGGIHPHALRHRRASLWYQQGVGPVELARWLGHSRPSMSLDRYSHVEPLKEIPHQTLETFLR